MRCLSPLKQRKNNKTIYGFDVETYGQSNRFYCATIFLDDNKYWQFFDRKKLIAFLKTKRFWNCYIAATNLMFDFCALFDGTDEMQKFRQCTRGSSFISAQTYIINGEFSVVSQDGKTHNRGKLEFIDSMNYAMIGVQKMGKILNIPKLESPACMGRKPKDEKEQKELLEYNKRDAEISKKFVQFLFKTFDALGASPRLTIASTALNLFRTRFLDKKYYVNDEDVLDDIFSAYYGGRTEVIARGTHERAELYCYDVNSLYPAMMLKDMPDPNTARTVYNPDRQYMIQYEGFSLVDVNVPEMRYPLLSVRIDGKLIFPTGEIRKQWYSNVELRRAEMIGCEVKHIYKMHYFRDTCKPFKKYVETLYELRKQYKADDNPMEYVVKLLLNSLYGKMAQKYKERDEIQPMEVMADKLDELDNFEVTPDKKFVRFKKRGRPSNFCFPLWSAYVTAYGRIRIHELLCESDAFYCDTDSIYTTKKMPSSNELGDIKEEAIIRKAVFVKPKFYAYETITGELNVKIKGSRLDKSWKSWNDLMINPHIERQKFIRFREGLRRGIPVNSIVMAAKDLSLEDEKRDWNGLEFDPKGWFISTPLILKEGMLLSTYKRLQKKSEEVYKDVKLKETREFLASDLFDRAMVGKDITPEEFLENELWHARHD